MSKFELMDGKKQLSRREAIQFNKTGKVPAREVPTEKMAYGFNGFGRYGRFGRYGGGYSKKDNLGKELMKLLMG